MSDPRDGAEPSCWRERFVAAFELTGNVSAAARAAGVHRGTAYRHRQVEPEFRAAWDEAGEVAADALEAEVRRRGMEGWEEPVYYNGVECGRIRKYDSKLLMFLLRALRPEKIRDHAPVCPTGDRPGRVEVVYVNDWRDNDWRDPPAVAATRPERPGGPPCPLPVAGPVDRPGVGSDAS
jgi:hypothetical protein